MILRLMSLCIPVAGFFAAGVLAGQAAPAEAPDKTPAAEAKADAEDANTDQKVIKLRVVRKDSEPGTDEVGETLVLDGEEIAGDVEEIVDEALTAALEALAEADEEIRVELDGKKLEALSQEHREALEKARERLKGMSQRVAQRMAEVEVRVEKAVKKAAAAAEKAGEALKESRVVILRGDGGKDTDIEVRKDEEGRTVIVIEGDDVKVITRDKSAEPDKGPAQEE